MNPAKSKEQVAAFYENFQSRGSMTIYGDRARKDLS